MQLRARITLVAISATLLVAAGLAIAGRLSQESVEARFEEAVHSGKSQLWKRILAAERSQMEQGVSALSRDKETRDALVAADRKLLAERAQTTFNLMSAAESISRMQIADVEGRVLFSAPQPFEGTSRKRLPAKALESGKITGGIERDDDGRLVNAIAFPLFSRGKPIGVGVFARELTPALNDFKRNDGSEVYLVEADGRLIAGTDDRFPQLAVTLPPLGAQAFGERPLEGRVYSVAVQPVTAAEGQPLAHLLTATDHTDSYHRQRSVNTIALGATLVGLLLVIGLLRWYLRRVLAPLGVAVRSLEAIAHGDLRAGGEAFTTAGNDEIGALLRAQSGTARVLREMIGEIETMTEAVAGSAQNLLQIAGQTSRDVAELQAESGHLGDAMERMQGTVGEVVHHAGGAASAAAAADGQAQAGREVVQQTLTAIEALVAEVEQSGGAIHELSEESSRIGAVIEVIRGIAEQTNLLALNAAIEAARAGEQGRGFAVVADEVRTLASRTQKSTEEIQGMIERLQRGTQRVVEVMGAARSRAGSTAGKARQAGEALDAIADQVGTISRMNGQIADAADRQGAAAGEIEHNIDRIGKIAGRSAMAAGETSAASEQLRQSAEQLRSQVHRFVL